VATSRRRERELARRRFERRRQAELERRARTRRRNSIIGAVAGTAVVIAVIVIVAIAVFGGGGSSKNNASLKAKSSATASASPSSTPAPAAPTKCATITPNPPTKGAPKFPAVGKLSSKLMVKDIKVGHGPAAKKGATVSVYYTGISCDTGKVFDSSYLHKPLQPFPVSPLGTASVITGWNQGLIGVKAGGVREMVIPASLAYGSTGSPPTIQGNDTLDFVVQVTSVKNGK
jgi:peptidylprolyl isomerase